MRENLSAATNTQYNQKYTNIKQGVRVRNKVKILNPTSNPQHKSSHIQFILTDPILTYQVGNPPPQIHNNPYSPPLNSICFLVKSLSHIRLFATPWTIAYQALSSMGFSRQEYWSGLPFPSPGDLPNSGIELGSPALQADALTSEPSGKPIYFLSQP